MASLLNQSRPPVFCPGCSHEQALRSLDKALGMMDLAGWQVCIVSDIGCSGLFDTFFHTHAFHGLHGRALTYAAGIKLAQPELKVIVTMGDGGLGIGGAHLLAACRRNLDLTLLILNNFNFGMTGGQFSATTPSGASVGSGFLNQLEKPFDAGLVAMSAGAGFVARTSAYKKDLAQVIEQAIEYDGFSVLDILGVCPGRYTRRNQLNPKMIAQELDRRPPAGGPVPQNQRPEYGQAYRRQAEAQQPADEPISIEARFSPPQPGRQEVVILGAAGGRVITAGELLCLAGLTAGLKVTQKNEYNITVLKGPSISELILSPEEIDYTGLDAPGAILALAPEGVERRRELFASLGSNCLVIRAVGVELPPSRARVETIDCKGQGLKKADTALAALAVLAGMNRVLSLDMLKAALEIRFKGQALKEALSLVDNFSRHLLPPE